jgi:hypothetical protein
MFLVLTHKKGDINVMNIDDYYREEIVDALNTIGSFNGEFYYLAKDNKTVYLSENIPQKYWKKEDEDLLKDCEPIGYVTLVNSVVLQIDKDGDAY